MFLPTMYGDFGDLGLSSLSRFLFFSLHGKGCCSPDEGQTPKRIEKLENHIRKHHQTVYCCFMAAKSLGLPHTFPSMANLGVVDKWIFNMMKKYSQIKSFKLRHTNHPNDYDQPNVCVCKHVTAKMSLNQQVLGNLFSHRSKLSRIIVVITSCIHFWY